MICQSLALSPKVPTKASFNSWDGAFACRHAVDSSSWSCAHLLNISHAKRAMLIIMSDGLLFLDVGLKTPFCWPFFGTRGLIAPEYTVSQK